MSTQHIRNISLRIFRQYLESKGLKCQSTKGGHEKWAGHCVNRPITLQSHIDPVPEFVVRQALRTLGVDKEDFFHFFDV